MSWSFVITDKSVVTAGNMQELTYNILNNGEVKLESSKITSFPSDAVVRINEEVKKFAAQWEAAEQIKLNEEIPVV